MPDECVWHWDSRQHTVECRVSECSIDGWSRCDTGEHMCHKRRSWVEDMEQAAKHLLCTEEAPTLDESRRARLYGRADQGKDAWTSSGWLGGGSWCLQRSAAITQSLKWVERIKRVGHERTIESRRDVRWHSPSAPWQEPTARLAQHHARLQ